jgi:hypothetical protein
MGWIGDRRLYLTSDITPPPILDDAPIMIPTLSQLRSANCRGAIFSHTFLTAWMGVTCQAGISFYSDDIGSLIQVSSWSPKGHSSSSSSPWGNLIPLVVETSQP